MSQPLKPASAAELGDMVAAAAAEGSSLELAAGGSKRELGRPVEAHHRLDLTELSGIQLYEPEELVLTAAAATPIAEIERLLAQRQQQLAFEPADLGPFYGHSPGRGTIGGVIACNLSGPRRIKAGAARDHFLGVAAVSGRGEQFKAGGRVVKNVTGYDLCKLLAGSHGTLAALVEVTVKVMPAPEDIRTLLLRGLDDAAAMRAMAAALGGASEVSGAAHLPLAAALRSWVGPVGGSRTSVTALRLEGPAASVAYRAAGLSRAMAEFAGAIDELGRAESEALWRQVRDVALLADDPRKAIWRLSVPPSEAAATVAAVATAEEDAWYYDWGGGLIWLALPTTSEQGGAPKVRAAVARSGGHATLMRAPEALRRAVPVFQPQPPPLAALTRRIKDSFDPARILNRGRMAPDL